MAEPCLSLLVPLLPLALDPVILPPLLLVLSGSQETAVESRKMQTPVQGVKSQVLNPMLRTPVDPQAEEAPGLLLRIMLLHSYNKIT